MNVILSIKPKYANAILKGLKKVEFRKVNFKQNIEKIYIYSSAPTQKIIGFFTLQNIVIDTPENLWNQYNTIGHIDKDAFFEYYENKKFGVALKIKTFTRFETALDPFLFTENFIPPQSYQYYNGDFLN